MVVCEVALSCIALRSRGVSGVTMAGDRLGIAAGVAQELGLELYAWFEYGTQAAYGALNGFASSSASKVCTLIYQPHILMYV